MPHHLVSTAQRGDHDAFAALITGRRDLAEDAVQDALIKAWRDLPRLREVDKFDAWLRQWFM